MSTLPYTMFERVVLPSAKAENDDNTLKLQTLKRFVPDPRKQLKDFPIVIFDLETTGLNFQYDRIIEIGAQKFHDGALVDSYETLVSLDSDIVITNEITRITGIERSMLAGKPPVADALETFFKFVSGCILVAHNADFDLGMIKAASNRLNTDLVWPSLCTVKMSRALLPNLPNYKLDSLAGHYGLTFSARHRAMGDIQVTADVFHNLLDLCTDTHKVWSDFQEFAS